MTPFSRISDLASSLARARVFKTFRLHFLMSMLSNFEINDGCLLVVLRASLEYLHPLVSDEEILGTFLLLKEPLYALDGSKHHVFVQVAEALK